MACECGFVVEGVEAEVIAVARRHAADAHGIDVAEALIRALAGRPDGRA